MRRRHVLLVKSEGSLNMFMHRSIAKNRNVWQLCNAIMVSVQCYSAQVTFANYLRGAMRKFSTSNCTDNDNSKSFVSHLEINKCQSIDDNNSNSNDDGDDDDDNSCWTCVCGFCNYDFRGDCFQCQLPRPRTSSISSNDSHKKEEFLTNYHVYHNEEDDNQSHKKTLNKDLSKKTISPPEENTQRICELWDKTATKYENDSMLNNNSKSRYYLEKSFERGDWLCSCGAHNFAKRIRCLKCGKTRTRDDPTLWSVSRSARKEKKRWNGNDDYSNSDDEEGKVLAPFLSINTNKAHTKHNGSSSSSTSVNHAHTNTIKARNFLPGDWLCASCNMHNFCSRDVCLQCGRSRHSTVLHVNTSHHANSASLSPPASSSSSSSSLLEESISKPSHVISGSQSVLYHSSNCLIANTVIDPHTWTCSACSAHNSLATHKFVCSICGTERDLTQSNYTGNELNSSNDENECENVISNKENSKVNTFTDEMEFDDLEDAHDRAPQELSELSERKQNTPTSALHKQSESIKHVELSALPCLSFHTHTIANNKTDTTIAPFGVHDWTCATCGFVNFGSRVICKRCRKSKPISASGNNWNNIIAEDMWACKCGYLNFKTRITCRECSKPKELVTGYDNTSDSSSNNNNSNDNSSSGNNSDTRTSVGSAFDKCKMSVIHSNKNNNDNDSSEKEKHT